MSLPFPLRFFQPEFTSFLFFFYGVVAPPKNSTLFYFLLPPSRNSHLPSHLGNSLAFFPPPSSFFAVFGEPSPRPPLLLYAPIVFFSSGLCLSISVLLPFPFQTLVASLVRLFIRISFFFFLIFSFPPLLKM